MGTIAERADQAELKYLSEILPELRAMALALDERTLAYLIELASVEAEMQLSLFEEELSSRSVRYRRL